MIRSERILYHQIHPAKLAADAASGLACLYFLWQRELVPVLLSAVAPPLVASALVLWLADLRPLEHSAFGRCVRAHMTAGAPLLRLLGFIVMALGAWYHAPLAILEGWCCTRAAAVAQITRSVKKP